MAHRFSSIRIDDETAWSPQQILARFIRISSSADACEMSWQHQSKMQLVVPSFCSFPPSTRNFCPSNDNRIRCAFYHSPAANNPVSRYSDCPVLPLLPVKYAFCASRTSRLGLLIDFLNQFSNPRRPPISLSLYLVALYP
jgi:hypothetical protein